MRRLATGSPCEKPFKEGITVRCEKRKENREQKGFEEANSDEGVCS